jgi:CspA family cold shock protein
VATVTGRVSFFNAERGWGFIKPDTGGPDLFAHASDLENAQELIANQRVTFEVGFDQRKLKPKAVGVRVI